METPARAGIDVYGSALRYVELERFGARYRLLRLGRCDFDFDIVVMVWGQSLSPGNEQRDFWGSASADIRGSRNLAGIKDPVIDDLIDLVISAPDRESLVIRTRALDRVLLWGHYVIPHWHIPYDRLVYWNKFDRPEKLTIRGTAINNWWVDPAKEAAITSRRNKS